jgi:hypothetical protein
MKVYKKYCIDGPYDDEYIDMTAFDYMSIVIHTVDKQLLSLRYIKDYKKR